MLKRVHEIIRNMLKKSFKGEPKKFRFRKYANIGVVDAIDDSKFLSESFLDTGELKILSDVSKPQCVIMGRTGSGKTALLERLNATEERIIRIEPENLALTYISNNGVLKFFLAAGVQMELFYRLLWRHIFAVEIIKERFQIVNATARDGFLSGIMGRLSRNKSREEALSYLLEWGSSFWEETDYRVKEITHKFETDLEASVKNSLVAKVPGISAETGLNAGLAQSLTEEQKAEVVHYGQSVVDRVQVRKLSAVIELLEKDFLEDKQKKYYITIDRLDENWINEEVKYHLIRALLETVRDFNNRIQNVKIVVALREDVADRVFRITRDPGYQEEKFKSMYLKLAWSEGELEEILDRRVNQFIREEYTSQKVNLRDLLPENINKSDSVNYLLERTMLRPRDLIMFFNKCIEAAQDKVKINKEHVLQAESDYSLDRLRALADEWSADYPSLFELSFCLKKYPKHFKKRDVETKLKEDIFSFLANREKQPEKLDSFCKELYEQFGNNDNGLMDEVLKVLYRVGLIGVKPETYLSVHWSYKGQKVLNFNDDAIFHIHPAFWRVLGVG